MTAEPSTLVEPCCRFMVFPLRRSPVSSRLAKPSKLGLKPAAIASEDLDDNRDGRTDEGSKLYDRLAQVASET